MAEHAPGTERGFFRLGVSRAFAWRAAAVLLLAYTVPLVDLALVPIRFGSWMSAWWNGLWLVALYLAAAAGLWMDRRWAPRMAVVLAALPAAVTPLVLLASRAPNPLRAYQESVVVAGACALALALLLGQAARTPREPARRGVPPLITAFGIEVALVAVFALLGDRAVGSVFWPTQFPGAMLLTAMNFCCGAGPDIVITDGPTHGWGGLTRAGIPILAIANTVGWLPMALLAGFVRRRLGRPAPVPREAAA